jgi:hypothetical protein
MDRATEGLPLFTGEEIGVQTPDGASDRGFDRASDGARDLNLRGLEVSFLRLTSDAENNRICPGLLFDETRRANELLGIRKLLTSDEHELV